MIRILLAVHLLLALAMVGVILLQRSEGGALGVGGGGTGFITGRQAGNLLTRTTALLATVFMITSLALAVLGGYDLHVPHRSILDQAAAAAGQGEGGAPGSVPAAAPAEMPALPSAFAVPPPPSPETTIPESGLAAEPLSPVSPEEQQTTP